jgi:hypothetical protein
MAIWYILPLFGTIMVVWCILQPFGTNMAIWYIYDPLVLAWPFDILYNFGAHIFEHLVYFITILNYYGHLVNLGPFGTVMLI